MRSRCRARRVGRRGRRSKPRPYQPVRRDFAFVVDESVPAEAVVRAVKGADKALVERATVFDLYTGKGVPEGKKSLAVEVVLQPTDRTLTDAEIEAVAARIVAQVAKATWRGLAELRPASASRSCCDGSSAHQSCASDFRRRRKSARIQPRKK